MSDPRTAAFDAVMEAVESYRQCERWNSTGIPAEYKAAVRRAVRALVVAELEALRCERVAVWHSEECPRSWTTAGGHPAASAASPYPLPREEWCDRCARIAELRQEEA